MSKAKRAKFHLKKGESLLKKGMMDYCMAGTYGHAAPGDAFLTNLRFYFVARLHGSGEYLTLEIPLADINYVAKTGIPILTRSMLIVADGRPYRFNVFLMGRWIKAVRGAAQTMQEAK